MLRVMLICVLMAVQPDLAIQVAGLSHLVGPPPHDFIGVLKVHINGLAESLKIAPMPYHEYVIHVQRNGEIARPV